MGWCALLHIHNTVHMVVMVLFRPIADVMISHRSVYIYIRMTKAVVVVVSAAGERRKARWANGWLGHFMHSVSAFFFYFIIPYCITGWTLIHRQVLQEGKVLRERIYCKRKHVIFFFLEMNNCYCRVVISLKKKRKVLSSSEKCNINSCLCVCVSLCVLLSAV